MSNDDPVVCKDDDSEVSHAELMEGIPFPVSAKSSHSPKHRPLNIIQTYFQDISPIFPPLLQKYFSCSKKC